MARRPSVEGVSDSGLGSLVRLRPLEIEQIPKHPDLASKQSNAPDIQTFVSATLEEANAFMTTYLPHHFKVRDSNKQAPPSTATVELSSKDITVEELPKEVREAGARQETWFARKSLHENAAKEGTASWGEFDGGLRADHSQHEKDYTPDVQDAHEVMNWDSSLQDAQRRIGDWEEVHASIMEMVHHIPTPLNNRVFTVLVIAAKRGHEFIVVQLPVAAASLPNTKYRNASKLTDGIYVSVERGELVEDGHKVEWQMATGSDAKGSLPMWAQKLGMPGAVVKDVGLFIDWCAKRRKA